MNNISINFRSLRFTTLLCVLLPMVIVLAACTASQAQPGLPQTGGTEAPAATSAPTEAVSTEALSTEAVSTEAPVEASINVRGDPALGPILVDGEGMTLYMFKKDEPNKSNCSGKCLQNWPPLLTQGKPSLGEGVDASLVGTATLPDGSKIITYNQMPLYYYIKDKKAGDVIGQEVGDVWYVVSQDGKVVEKATAGKPAETPAATEVTTSAPAAFQEPTIMLANDPSLGPVLVDGEGMTLYMFKKDGPNKSNCSGKCLQNWPPLLTKGKPVVGEGVDASLIGTATLPDGSMIVTYNQMPLYYYVKDKKAGDVTGQGVGEVWYVVSPDGKPVGQDSPQPTSSGYPAAFSPAASSQANLSFTLIPVLYLFLAARRRVERV